MTRMSMIPCVEIICIMRKYCSTKVIFIFYGIVDDMFSLILERTFELFFLEVHLSTSHGEKDENTLFHGMY